MRVGELVSVLSIRQELLLQFPQLHSIDPDLTGKLENNFSDLFFLSFLIDKNRFYLCVVLGLCVRYYGFLSRLVVRTHVEISKHTFSHDSRIYEVIFSR